MQPADEVDSQAQTGDPHRTAKCHRPATPCARSDTADRLTSFSTSTAAGPALHARQPVSADGCSSPAGYRQRDRSLRLVVDAPGTRSVTVFRGGGVFFFRSREPPAPAGRIQRAPHHADRTPGRRGSRVT